MNEKFKMTKLLIDAGVTWYPTQVADHILADKEIKHAFELLKAEKEGKLIMPPCKVGDKVYRIYTQSWIGEDTVCELIVSDRGICYVDDKGRETSCDKFGKSVFLSREDAEKVLKEIKK